MMLIPYFIHTISTRVGSSAGVRFIPMWPLRVPNLAGAARCHACHGNSTLLFPSLELPANSTSHSRRSLCVAAKKGKQASPYHSTVTLPKTGFSLKANSVVREPEIQKFWEDNKVYEGLCTSNPGEVFTLHDGPPYANGDLHVGHALNKILKDFINRYKLLRGKKAWFVPGWDTHGLPIELKVLQNISKEEKQNLTPLDLRKRARTFAEATVSSQMEQFKRFGVWADWEQPYLTLQNKYEAAQLGVFGKMVGNGHIYRGRKPVHWSPSSQTALAEAELEYPEGHTSQSCYVAFSIEDGCETLKDHMPSSLAIWTTTPWTIPANRAVAINPSLEYTLVEVDSTASQAWNFNKIIVALDLVEQLEEKFGVSMKVICSFKGSELEGVTYRHPLFPDKVQPVVIGGDYVTTESGTGLVHTAPGHGQEDYKIGMKYGLEVFSPVDDYGRFTEDAGIFDGMRVLTDGNKAVLKELSKMKCLLKEEPYQHKYPYDWRTKKPIIFRATDQWFASVDEFREATTDAVKKVKWVPSSGFNRITGMIQGRSDWCISRQRRWGVPIPAFYDKVTGEPLMSDETISHVQKIVLEEGTDAWWEKDTEHLLPDSLKHRAKDLRKGEDTMDVWFDSGSSWASVLLTEEKLRYPANLYLEGSDQHRGWFQSSLLTSVATNGLAPYEQVLTHGFVLDESGNKMSKSLGNIVDPQEVILGGSNQKQNPALGADVLRLWVSSVDYSSDVSIGPGILKQTSEVYRKLRGTIRFLLGNLFDFDPQEASIPYEQLPSIDRYILSQFAIALKEIEGGYEDYQFSRYLNVMNKFVVSDLSNFYLDVAKDRLYIPKADSFARRSCQTVLNELFRGMVSSVAPILPHLAEDAWSHSQMSSTATSVFNSGWYDPSPQWTDSCTNSFLSSWEQALGLREIVTKTLEIAREQKLVGASMEACVLIHVEHGESLPGAVSFSDCENGVDEMRYLFLTSQVERVEKSAATECEYHTVANVEGLGEVAVGVKKAVGHKCARCWNYSDYVGTNPVHPQLCERCLPVVEDMGFTPAEPVGAGV